MNKNLRRLPLLLALGIALLPHLHASPADGMHPIGQPVPTRLARNASPESVPPAAAPFLRPESRLPAPDSARGYLVAPDIPHFTPGHFQARKNALRHDVLMLAGDAMEGRFTGSPQDRAAALYIAREFQHCRLVPFFPVQEPYHGDSVGKAPKDYWAPYEFKSRWGEQIQSRNVIGVVPGTDSLLGERYIVVGAHYDHLGWGDKGGNSRNTGGRAIHNGADDNASGVAMLLELVRYYQQHPLPRTLVFVAFSGEEIGLCGSQAFLDQLPFPVRQIDAMFNLDMLGHLQDNTFCICGTGTSKEAESMVKEAAKRTDLELTTYPDGHGPSDHAVFYDRKVPVFFFSTPPTATYHTPADDPNTLDYDGMVRLSSVIGDLLEQAGKAESLTFTSSGKPNRKMMGMGQFKATLGLMPDINNTDQRGLRTMIVVEGKPAHNAGIRSGDVLLKVAGKRVHTLDDYMDVLATLSFGEQIQVRFISKETGKKQTVTVDLDAVAGKKKM